MSRSENGAADVSNGAAVACANDSAVQSLANRTTYGALLAKIARSAFLLMLAAMLVSWAMTMASSNPRQEQPKPQPSMHKMYS
jgi:hypothetical protein